LSGLLSTHFFGTEAGSVEASSPITNPHSKGVGAHFVKLAPGKVSKILVILLGLSEIFIKIRLEGRRA
jgi:hypothetical protein